MPHQKFSLIEERNYIKIAIYFENSDDHVDVKQLKFFLDNTLKTAFGIIGASVSDFDILSLRKKSANSNEPITVLLRVHCDGLKTLWGAITMCTTLNDICSQAGPWIVNLVTIDCTIQTSIS
ncbi:Ribonuclease P/MRP protein subunit [Plasmopara halstedii]|uniref:Ribonuclease P/MRP protein subunit n=1 Tax=Plasmopara halstedii TaxID=4781 RepID=A0A0P1ADL9_PLAHL|nr:Ribonuclease P/MRP protein subunit [Plasmopara halstedii]CEG38556.1 Ribonuclease P/MRP protein subunit [Plasmopara halstedii]|eukprot:XP_024574925.1 Ribonuclease P/MRP protein subunit [Plasmopara halstedii]